LTRLLLGSTAATLARYVRAPLLIVKGARPALRRILLCTGGEAVADANARLGGQIAAVTGADVTVLHVMSQLPLAPEADTVQLQASADEAIQAGTREGLHLQHSLALLHEAGATGDLRPKIRHGLVVDEILAEVQAGDYDLLIIGAHRAPGERTWRGLTEMLLDDVADQLLSHCPRPVLVVRGPQ
jgi:nucleotide-binding universal stress UspA family protein